MFDDRYVGDIHCYASYLHVVSHLLQFHLVLTPLRSADCDSSRVCFDEPFQQQYVANQAANIVARL